MKDINIFIQDMVLEADLLYNFARLEKDMQNAVSEQNWSCLDEIVLRLKKKAEMLNKIEKNRIASFNNIKKRLKVSEETSFIKILALVHHKQRPVLSSAYRKLKNAVFLVKGATSCLQYYFKSVSDSIRKVLMEIFPYKKGKIYKRDGKAIEISDDPILLNKSL